MRLQEAKLNKFSAQLKSGPVAHLVERLMCTEEVAGSSPVGSTKVNKISLSRKSRLILFRKQTALLPCLCGRRSDIFYPFLREKYKRAGVESA